MKLSATWLCYFLCYRDGTAVPSPPTINGMRLAASLARNDLGDLGGAGSLDDSAAEESWTCGGGGGTTSQAHSVGHTGVKRQRLVPGWEC